MIAYLFAFYSPDCLLNFLVPEIYFSACFSPAVCLLVCTSTWLFACPPVHLSTCPPVRLSACSPVGLFACLLSCRLAWSLAYPLDFFFLVALIAYLHSCSPTVLAVPSSLPRLLSCLMGPLLSCFLSHLPVCIFAWLFASFNDCLHVHRPARGVYLRASVLVLLLFTYWPSCVLNSLLVFLPASSLGGLFAYLLACLSACLIDWLLDCFLHSSFAFLSSLSLSVCSLLRFCSCTPI